MKIRNVLFMGLIGLASLSPAFGSLIYDNTGPDSGSAAQAFHIDNSTGWEISDSFTLTSAATINSIDFLVWTDSGATLNNVDWSISSADFAGGTVYGSAAGVAVATGSVCSACASGVFDLDSDTITGLSVLLTAGTYYLTFENGVTSDASGIAGWDESNNSSSNAYQANPSQAVSPTSLANENDAGTDSETFSLYSSTPEPGTWMLFGSGLLAVAFGMQRRNKLRA